jgi:hypothetical protein
MLLFMALISVSKTNSSFQESKIPGKTSKMADSLWEDKEVRFDIPL